MTAIPVSSRTLRLRTFGHLAGNAPLYLLLLPAYAILHVYNRFDQLLEVEFIWKECVRLTAIPLAIYLLCAALLRSWKKAALFCTVPTLLSIFGAPVKVWLELKVPGFFSSYLFCGLLVLLVLALLWRTALRAPRRLTVLLRFTNALGAIYLLIEITRLLTFPASRNYLGDPDRKLEKGFTPCAGCQLPDIYYIVFDEYGSRYQLAKLGFTDTSISAFLREHRFYIPERSRSNYPSTLLSMSSVFNMQYHSNFDTARYMRYHDYLRGHHTLARAELFPILQKQGYELYNYSWMKIRGTSNRLPRYDYWNQWAQFRDFNLTAHMHATLGWHLPSPLRFTWGYTNSDFIAWRDAYHRHIRSGLDSLVRLPDGKPRFVYAHFELPHSPLVYDSLGHLRRLRHLNSEERVSGYLDQIRLANRYIRELVTTLQQQQPKDRPLVIVLQSDHGYRGLEGVEDPAGFENFSALYFSNGDYHLVPQDFHLVNTFRFLLNTFFHSHYPMLPYHSVSPPAGKEHE